jgi:hypothetical protein
MRSRKTSQVMALLWAAITLTSGAGITATARAAETLRDQDGRSYCTVTEITRRSGSDA